MEFNPWLHFWDGIGEVLEYKKQTWKKQLHSCLWHHQFKNRIGSGDRIWTCDLRVMSPTSYQTAPPRNYCVFDVTVILRFGMPSQNNQSRLKGIGSGDRILNLWPSGYEPDELPDCSTPQSMWNISCNEECNYITLVQVMQIPDGSKNLFLRFKTWIR